IINKSVHDMVDFSGDLAARAKSLENHPIQSDATGRLTADVSLTFTVAGRPATVVTILQAAAASDTSIDDLVAVINAALQATPVGNGDPNAAVHAPSLGSLVVARNDNGQVAFATVNAGDTLAISGGNRTSSTLQSLLDGILGLPEGSNLVQISYDTSVP